MASKTGRRVPVLSGRLRTRAIVRLIASLTLVVSTASVPIRVGAQQQAPQAPVNPMGAQSLGSQATQPMDLVQLSGIARTSSNGAVPYAPVRLRDAQTGRVVATTNANETGAFTFGAVKPGYYVVEMLDQAGNVITTSPLITANAGDIVSTLVKLPVHIVPGGFLGGATSAGAAAGTTGAGIATLAAVVSAAASAGVLAVAATGKPVSPEK